MSNTSVKYDVFKERVFKLMSSLYSQKEFSYGEGVTILTHALQVAHFATEAGGSKEGIVGSLKHDVGNARSARNVYKEKTGYLQL